MKIVLTALLALLYHILLMLYLSFLIIKVCGWFDIDILIYTSQRKLIGFLFILCLLKIALFQKAKPNKMSNKELIIMILGNTSSITFFALTAYLASILF